MGLVVQETNWPIACVVNYLCGVNKYMDMEANSVTV